MFVYCLLWFILRFSRSFAFVFIISDIIALIKVEYTYSTDFWYYLYINSSNVPHRFKLDKMIIFSHVQFTLYIRLTPSRCLRCSSIFQDHLTLFCINPITSVADCETAYMIYNRFALIQCDRNRLVRCWFDLVNFADKIDNLRDTLHAANCLVLNKSLNQIKCTLRCWVYFRCSSKFISSFQFQILASLRQTEKVQVK